MSDVIDHPDHYAHADDPAYETIRREIGLWGGLDADAIEDGTACLICAEPFLNEPSIPCGHSDQGQVFRHYCCLLGRWNG